MSEHAAVKECDIRGPWPEEVDATFFEQAGRNFGATVAGGSFAGFHPATVVVGGDGRASTPALRAALQGGLLAEGVDVFDVVGATPTPALYWIRQVLAAQAVAIVTASHSPPHWNGLKVMNGPLPPTPAEVEALDVAPPPRREAGRRHAIGNVVDTYVAARIAPFAAAGLPGLDVVVDPGGGCMAGVASRAFRELGAAVDALHDELDPAFRQRHPDCAVPKHLAELAARVPAIGAAMGVAFDGDGDRLAVIDDRGRYVPAEKVAMLLVEGPLAVRPGDVVVLDIKASMQLERAVARRGGIPVRMKSGHAYMKRAVIERGAVLGSEVSGHLFFGALSGIDDPLHALLPQRVVLHLHSVNALAWEVRSDGEARVAERLAGLPWAWVPYHRPGLPLTRAVRAPAAAGVAVLALANHGIVVGADDCIAGEALVREVERRLAVAARPAPPPAASRLVDFANASGYRPAADPVVHALATDAACLAWARQGVLYPDHVVFLGGEACVVDDLAALSGAVAAHRARNGAEPAALLVPGAGVLVAARAPAAAEEMLRCQAEVLLRLIPLLQAMGIKTLRQAREASQKTFYARLKY